MEKFVCPLCNDSMFYEKQFEHFQVKHKSLVAYTLRVENLMERNVCEACSFEVIKNYNLEKGSFGVWYSLDLPDTTEIRLKQEFSNASLFESGCSICLGNY